MLESLVVEAVGSPASKAHSWIAPLQWLVGRRRGAEAADGQQDPQGQQVRWTAELHAALVQLRALCESGQPYDAPRRVQWLAGLVAEVGAALGGAAGGA